MYTVKHFSTGLDSVLVPKLVALAALNQVRKFQYTRCHAGLYVTFGEDPDGGFFLTPLLFWFQVEFLQVPKVLLDSSVQLLLLYI